MMQRKLGSRSGIDVTDVGLGLWAVAGSEWGPVEDAGSLDAIEAALEAGITFFDTADVYGAGHSEELLGQAMKGRRDRFIVATKIGWIDFDREAGRADYEVNRRQILALSQEWSLLSPLTAFLVLETEQDYKRFGLTRRGLSDLLVVNDGGLRLRRRAPHLRKLDRRARSQTSSLLS